MQADWHRALSIGHAEADLPETSICADSLEQCEKFKKANESRTVKPLKLKACKPAHQN